MKKPWEDYPKIWPTESRFFSFLRGGIRRGLWEKHPVKLTFIKKNRGRITNPKPSERFPTVWGGVCSCCNLELATKHLQVDHKKGGHSLRSSKDLQAFIEGLVFITEDDLAFLCKPCHDIKTYSEKHTISFEEARLEKRVILVMKREEVVKRYLRMKGFSSEDTSNAKKRKDIMRKVVQEKSRGGADG